MSAASPPPPPPIIAPAGPTILGYAGFWWRVLAALVDLVILRVAIAILGLVTGWRELLPVLHGDPSGDDAPVAAVAYTYSHAVPLGFPRLGFHGGALTLAGVLVTILYFTLFESSRWQATPGKRACRLTVSDLSGGRIGIARALARYLAKFISAMLLGIGYLMVAWTHRKQGLHDKIAGTLVLRRRPADTVFAFAPPPA